MYYLRVTLNYPDRDEEYQHVNVNSQRALYDISREYLNDPNITSVVFTVVPLRSTP
jgi:hypothetical protein